MCGEEKSLIKAHIIPRAFFKAGQLGDGTPILVDDEAQYKFQRSPNGVYDQSILCGSCERSFQDCDDYGIKVLLTDFENFFRPIPGGFEAIHSDAAVVDKTLLLRFLIAVIWRASISTQTFYREVNLGPYENVALEFLKLSQTAAPIAFDAVLACWETTHLNSYAVSVLTGPTRTRLNQSTSYRVSFGKITAFVKASGTSFMAPFAPLSVASSPILRIMNRDFGESVEFDAIRTVAINAGPYKR
jgi:hypothetical protein